VIDREPSYWAEIEAAWDARPLPPRPRRLGTVRSSALAAAVLLGMQAALEPPRREQVVIEVDVDRPVGPAEGVLLHFDEGSPRRTVAVLTGVQA
jgi:hypothetical protein